MNCEQQKALEYVQEGHNVFSTGGIGTEKTATIMAIVAHLRQDNISAAVTASTGLASQQLHGKFINYVHCRSPNVNNEYSFKCYLIEIRTLKFIQHNTRVKNVQQCYCIEMIKYCTYVIFMYYVMEISGGGGAAQKIERKVLFSTKKVAKYR